MELGADAVLAAAADAAGSFRAGLADLEAGDAAPDLPATGQAQERAALAEGAGAGAGAGLAFRPAAGAPRRMAVAAAALGVDLAGANGKLDELEVGHAAEARMKLLVADTMVAAAGAALPWNRLASAADRTAADRLARDAAAGRHAIRAAIGLRRIARFTRLAAERRPAELRRSPGRPGAALEPWAAFAVGITDRVFGGAAAAIGAGHAIAAIIGLLARAAERAATVRGVEVEGEAALGHLAALAALARVLAW